MLCQVCQKSQVLIFQSFIILSIFSNVNYRTYELSSQIKKSLYFQALNGGTKFSIGKKNTKKRPKALSIKSFKAVEIVFWCEPSSQNCNRAKKQPKTPKLQNAYQYSVSERFTIATLKPLSNKRSNAIKIKKNKNR